MSGRGRRAFERHIIECEDCWDEVEEGRRGRALAESSRELAPQRLREMVRSTVAAAPASGRSLAFGARLGALAASATLALVVAFVVLQPSQPPEIEVLLSDYNGTEQLHDQTRAALPSALGDLELLEVRSGRIEDTSVVVHEYANSAGQMVAIYQSDSPFPSPGTPSTAHLGRPGARLSTEL